MARSHPETKDERRMFHRVLIEPFSISLSPPLSGCRVRIPCCIFFFFTLEFVTMKLTLRTRPPSRNTLGTSFKDLDGSLNIHRIRRTNSMRTFQSNMCIVAPGEIRFDPAEFRGGARSKPSPSSSHWKLNYHGNFTLTTEPWRMSDVRFLIPRRVLRYATWFNV